jgi:hypothetical protein
VEVRLVAESRVSTLKVGRELMAQLFLGVQGPWGQVHEPRPSQASQGHREVVGHNGFIPSCSKDGGGIDLQELGGVDKPIVFFLARGAET